MRYIKIKSKSWGRENKKGNIVMRLIFSFLKLIVPKANPDFDDRISIAAYWLLEFEDEHSTPEREIGLNSNEDVIMKMPYRDNYGYWVDNNLTFDDFQKTFESVEITKEYFDEKWKIEP